MVTLLVTNHAMKVLSSKLALLALAACGFAAPSQAQDRLMAWNDLGMHCLDPDFSVFSILPPFNTQNVQLIRNGQLVLSPVGITVTYEAMADPTGSINTSSVGKTNFWDHVLDLFGVSLPVDTGLGGFSMPGASNTPQAAHHSAAFHWFQAEGVPLTPLDDSMSTNPYSMFRWVARNSQGQEIASTVTSVPASQEMACVLCHASGASAVARPSSGWVYDTDPKKDDRLNILRLHDDRQGSNPLYQTALAALGMDPAGMEATVRNQGRSILCASCHGTNALPGTGYPGVKPMTQAMHGLHANAHDPMGNSLGVPTGRASCYTCHPGTDTQCLRGAMGKAIGPDGQPAMDCQACHGNMNTVADPNRAAWFEEPNCQACHAGSATQNPGQIRYTSVFDGNGQVRQPANDLFATNPDTPAAGISLYRFSTGHGDLQCSACHGSPHAIYPTSEVNDNLQSIAAQGHEGTMQECSACHSGLSTAQQTMGPHGMHPTTAVWVRDIHGDWAENHGAQSCQACHGVDYKGTVLSEAKADRSYNTPMGQKNFYRGFQVGCYTCHDGPTDDDTNNNAAPLVRNLPVTTHNDEPLDIQLVSFDANGDALQYKILTQPEHGTVGWAGSVATYYPEAGYVGTVSFQYATRDGETQSQRGTVTVDVTPSVCGSTAETFGFGSPGLNGEVPRLRVEGCATPGATASLLIDHCPPNANMYLLEGPARHVREVWPGGVVRVMGPFSNLYMLTADATGQVQFDLD
ncbi:MAG: cadherin-like domain-containing protein, partial [Planctomycetes bacterium]|nr:cadherin-like domain-containing protein [Planctomycetota bacterium]